MIVGWRGVAVELTGEQELLAGVRDQLPPFLDSAGEVISRGSLHGDDSALVLDLPDGLGLEVDDRAEFFRAAASRVELTLAHHVTDRVCVHAGVVAHEGRALLLPGRSLAGKSTLVRALVAAGATYWSDDLAPLDDRGQVHPYPRATTRRTPKGSVRELPVGAVEADHEPIPVAVIALLQHDPSGDWAVDELSAGQAVLGLVDNCVSMRRNPALALDVLTRTAQTATCLRGSRGEAEQAAQALLELLARP